tara:strand:- start:233 stop:1654 length:1422 start_codon:yes stop_codon:yes gene_type:complete
MNVLLNINDKRFSLNGVEYFKNFTPLVIGGKLKIVNTYDAKIELTDLLSFDEFTVDGNTFLSVESLQSALLPVLFTRGDLSGGGTGGAEELNDLTDVTLGNITNGQALIYNSTSGKWENEDVSGDFALNLVDGETFNGVFDVSEQRTRKYNDLFAGNLGVLTLSSIKAVGSICTVRIGGAVNFDILDAWNLRGDDLSNDSNKLNTLILVYFSDSDIRIVNTVVDNTVVFDPETISPNYLRHLFSPDNVTVLDVGGQDEIQASNDLFLNTEYNLIKTSEAPILTLDSSGYSAKFDYSVGGGQSMKVDLTNSINTIFRSSFSGYLKVRMLDGVPAIEASYFLNLLNGTSSRFWLDVRSSGVVTLAYTSNSVSRFAQTSAAVFADGESSEYSILAFTLNSAGSMKIYKDAVELPLNGGLNGNLTGVNMTLFDNGTSDLFLGNYDNVNDKGVSMHLKDFAIQQGVYSQTDLNNLQNV